MTSAAGGLVLVGGGIMRLELDGLLAFLGREVLLLIAVARLFPPLL